MHRGPGYSIKDAYQQFMMCYSKLGRLDNAFLYIANQYHKRMDKANAIKYIDEALKTNESNADAYVIKFEFSDDSLDIIPLRKAIGIDPNHAKAHYEVLYI